MSGGSGTGGIPLFGEQVVESVEERGATRELAGDSLAAGVTELLGRSTGGGLDSPTERLREVVEIPDDMLAHHPSSFLR